MEGQLGGWWGVDLIERIGDTPVPGSVPGQALIKASFYTEVPCSCRFPWAFYWELNPPLESRISDHGAALPFRVGPGAWFCGLTFSLTD